MAVEVTAIDLFAGLGGFTEGARAPPHPADDPPRYWPTSAGLGGSYCNSDRLAQIVIQ